MKVKRLLLINSVCGHGSTGKICGEIAEKYEKDGWEVKIAYGRDSYVPERFQRFAVRITSDFAVRKAALEARLLDNAGFSNSSDTKKFLAWADKFQPDVVWLHNLHGYYINVELLFNWLKKHPDLQVKWTLHDCWAFTGHCSYFTMVKCERWRSHCSYCPQKKAYPKSCFLDRSAQNFNRKRAAFTGIRNMTLITPSKWLADLVRQSFLQEYPVKVIHNTIDTNIFKPTPSDFRRKYGLEDKIIILGVANVWDKRKGLYDFYKLAQMLDDRYAIVLVGLSKKQIADLPKNIKGLQRTNSQTELAAIYTAADVLVNPSVEETYGMTQVEAKACGTPSIVYKDTACEEIANTTGNAIVEQNAEAIAHQVQGGVENGLYTKNKKSTGIGRDLYHFGCIPKSDL